MFKKLTIIAAVSFGMGQCGETTTTTAVTTQYTTTTTVANNDSGNTTSTVIPGDNSTIPILPDEKPQCAPCEPCRYASPPEFIGEGPGFPFDDRFPGIQASMLRGLDISAEEEKEKKNIDELIEDRKMEDEDEESEKENKDEKMRKSGEEKEDEEKEDEDEKLRKAGEEKEDEEKEDEDEKLRKAGEEKDEDGEEAEKRKMHSKCGKKKCGCKSSKKGGCQYQHYGKGKHHYNNYYGGKGGVNYGKHGNHYSSGKHDAIYTYEPSKKY